MDNYIDLRELKSTCARPEYIATDVLFAPGLKACASSFLLDLYSLKNVEICIIPARANLKILQIGAINPRNSP